MICLTYLYSHGVRDFKAHLSGIKRPRIDVLRQKASRQYSSQVDRPETDECMIIVVTRGESYKWALSLVGGVIVTAP